ncbi:hypothetical protein CRYUN_Cryun07bG0008500 [Craigia yunnanensis]
MPGGRHAMHHSGLLQNAGAPRVLRATAAASTAAIQAKIFAKIVLRNLEHHDEVSRGWSRPPHPLPLRTTSLLRLC